MHPGGGKGKPLPGHAACTGAADAVWRPRSDFGMC